VITASLPVLRARIGFVIEVAADAMIRTHLPPPRGFLAAPIPGVRTARGEAAAAGHRRQGRHLPGNRFQAAAAPRQVGQGGEQLLRIGMAWRGKEGRARRLFDDLAGVHDADAGRHLRDDAEVVGDQQHTHRPFGSCKRRSSSRICA
jgi:hypothetical protein